MLRSNRAQSSSTLVILPILNPKVLHCSIQPARSSLVGCNGFNDFTSMGKIFALKKRRGPRCI